MMTRSRNVEDCPVRCLARGLCYVHGFWGITSTRGFPNAGPVPPELDPSVFGDLKTPIFQIWMGLLGELSSVIRSLLCSSLQAGYDGLLIATAFTTFSERTIAVGNRLCSTRALGLS